MADFKERWQTGPYPQTVRGSLMVGQSQTSENDFIVRWTRCALKKQQQWTVFGLAYRVVSKKFGFNEKNKKGFVFVNTWALICLALATSFYVASFCTESTIFFGIVGILFAARFWEQAPYVLKVSIFTEPNKGTADILDARRTVILGLLNYLEMIFWFATIYSILYSIGGYLDVKGGAFACMAILRESIMLMVANSTDVFAPMSRTAWAVLCLQNLFGLFMTLVVVARFVAFLPTPKTQTD